MKTDERPRTLDQVVQLLGGAYSEWKDAEKAKNQYKDEFFDFADQKLRDWGLGLTMMKLTAPDEATAVTRALLHNPGWQIDTHRPHRFKEDEWEFVLIEDPSLQAFSYEFEGMKYARTVSKGPVMIDDEWLLEEDPDLYEKVTFQLPWGAVVPVPIEALDPEVVGMIGKYVYTGKPRVSLAAPRKLKEEE